MCCCLKVSLSWIFVMSPKFGTPGQRCASTALGKGSISLSQAADQPRGCHATLAASIPEHTLPYTIPMPV